ncbi:MAG: hypothetical protein HQ564_03785, partial [Candidatus Saganbacteria bacterium]|nr:hypothetical protein [Candidatus Saganbacteria bacterium]
MNAHKFIKHKKNIRSHLSAFFLVLIIIGGLWVGCGKQGKNAQPEILIKTQISPEVNAQAVEYGDN